MSSFDLQAYLENELKGLESAQAPPVPSIAAPSSALRRVADVPVAFARGVAKLPNVAVGIADIFTGGKTGKFIEDTTGYDFGAADKFYNQMLTPETQAAQQEVSKTFKDEGFVSGIGSAITHPSTIAQTVAESVPAMLAGGGVARIGINALSKAVPAIASKLAPLAVGAGEGAVTAGSIAEDIRTQNPDRELTGTQAGLSALAGAATMGIGAAGSKLANSAVGRKLGLADIDSIVAGVVRESGEGATPNVFKRAAAGIVQEGLLEELPQSMQEQALQNIAQGKSWQDGMAEAAGMGLLSGGLMGAGSSAVFGGGKASSPVTDPTEAVPPTPLVDAEAVAQQVDSLPTLQRSLAKGVVANSSPLLNESTPAETPFTPHPVDADITAMAQQRIQELKANQLPDDLPSEEISFLESNLNNVPALTQAYGLDRDSLIADYAAKNPPLPVKSPEEITRDEAIAWRDSNLAEKPHLLKVNGEDKRSYEQRLVAEYLKNREAPTNEVSTVPGNNTQDPQKVPNLWTGEEDNQALTLPPEVAAVQRELAGLKGGEVADYLKTNIPARNLLEQHGVFDENATNLLSMAKQAYQWANGKTEALTKPAVDPVQQRLDAVTDEDRGFLDRIRSMVDGWQKGGKNEYSNKTEIMPFLSSWGKTTPAEVGQAITNFLDGKKLGDVQRLLVDAALQEDRTLPQYAPADTSFDTELLNSTLNTQNSTLRTKAALYAGKAGDDVALLDTLDDSEIQAYVNGYEKWAKSQSRGSAPVQSIGSLVNERRQAHPLPAPKPAEFKTVVAPKREAAFATIGEMIAAARKGRTTTMPGNTGIAPNQPVQPDNVSSAFPHQADIHADELAKRLAAGGLTPDNPLHNEVVGERRQRERAPDAQTGLIAREHHYPTLNRAWQEHQNTGRNFSYASIDIANLGGLNKWAGGNAQADVYMKGMADIISTEISKAFPTAQIFRRGGDEFAIIAPDVSTENLSALLDKVQKDVIIYTEDNGMADIPHPKGGQPGVGIYAGAVDFNGFNSASEAEAAADARVELKKGEQNVNRKQTEKAGTLALEGQTGRAEESTGAKSEADQSITPPSVKKTAAQKDNSPQQASLDLTPTPDPVTSDNKIFTEDAYLAAKARMQKRLSQLNMGLDPELMMDGLTIAGYHLERGAHSFLKYSRAMIAELGEEIRPYLKSFYNGVRDLPGVPFVKEMDDYQTVANYDVDRLTLETIDEHLAVFGKEPVEQAAEKTGLDVKAIRAARFAETRRKHLTEKLAKAPDRNEKKRLNELLTKLEAERDKLAVKPILPEEAPIIAPAAGKPEKDEAPEAYFKKGERVQTSKGHGEIVKASTGTITSMTYGGRGLEGKAIGYSHMYEVRYDNGVQSYASFHDMNHETDPAPKVVPAPVYNLMAQEPDALLRAIQYAKERAMAARAKASRAKKTSSIQDAQNVAKRHDEDATKMQAAYDQWANEYNVQPVTAPVQTATDDKPGVKMTLKDTIHTKKNIPLFIVKMDSKVERDEYERLNRDAKRTGNGWDKFSKGFQFLEKAAAEAFIAKHGGTGPVVAEVPLPAGVVKPEDSPYWYRKDGDKWQWSTNKGESWGTPFEPPLAFKDKLETLLAAQSPAEDVSEDSIVAARSAGDKAYNDGLRRLVPAGWGKDEQAAWYQGWDAANLAAPVESKQKMAQADKPVLSYSTFLKRVVDRLQDNQSLRNAAINSDKQNYELEYMTQYKKAALAEMRIAVDENYQVNEAYDRSSKNDREALGNYIDRLRDKFRGESRVEEYGFKVGDALEYQGSFNADIKPGEQVTVVSVVDGGNYVNLSNGKQVDSRSLQTNYKVVSKKSSNEFATTENNGTIKVKEGGVSNVTEPAATSGNDRTGTQGTSAANVQRVAAGGNTPDLGSGIRRGNVSELPGLLQSGENEDTGEQTDERGSDSGAVLSRPTSVGTSASGVAGVLRSDARDFRIPTGGLTRTGSWRSTAERNLDIVQLIKTLREEDRLATPEEQALLSLYTGWGAADIRNNLFPGYAQHGRLYKGWAKPEWKSLVERVVSLFTNDELKTAARSSQYAHYTSEAITRSIWSALGRMGFAGGKTFEPGMGIGNFPGTMPDSMYHVSRYTGIEFDNLTAEIAKHLYPQQNIIHGDFTKQKFPSNFFDLAIGNPPFSQTVILTDPDYKKNKFSLHDYFFAKSIDKVRPGGLLVFVTSRHTMDKQGDKARAYLSERADLVGAIRLPQTAFKQQSGTEVVTDVIFLRKRAEGEAVGGHAWQGLAEVSAGDEKVMVNEYFAANGQMVLGTHATESSQYRSNEYTVKPHEGTDIENLFEVAAQSLPANIYSVVKQSPKEQKAVVVERDFNPKNKKEGGLYLSEKGEVMRVEFGSGVPLSSMVKLTDKETAWIQDAIPLRDAMKQARYDQFSEGDWEKSLKGLNKAYDAFVKKHGRINEFTLFERKEKDEDGNEIRTEYRRYKYEKLLRQDVEGPLLEALERVSDDGEITKGDILVGRTIAKPQRSTSPESISDALALSLDETGRLDLDHIAGMMKLSTEEVIESLGDMIFENPAGGKQELADEYLSGDVVTKLAEAEEAAKNDARYQRNVKALVEVQPRPLTPRDVTVSLGVPWMPLEHIEDFAGEVLGVNVNIGHNPAINTWTVGFSSPESSGYGRRRSSKAAGKQSARSSTAEWGTVDRGANEILDSILNQRPIRITYRDNDGKTHVDEAANTRVNEIAERMKDRFRSWIWEDAGRAGEILELYNKRYNNLAPRRFDGSHMTMPGLSTKYTLHPFQKRVIWRMIQTGNTYLAHSVGAGKTLEMIAAGMEMKRLGLISKPMYIVPNDQLSQWTAEFMEAYPMANVMVADEDNFHTSNRRRFMAQAAVNKPDAIIITHSALGKLKMKPESVAPVKERLLAELREALSDAEDDDAPRYLISRMEQMVEKAEQRFDSIVANDKGDNVITFEDMGVDFLFVDEAHNFRKLDFTTNQQIKGIDPNGSTRALDLYLKTKHLDGLNPGRSHVFASGTPITNTIGELYTVMRFFAEEEMGRDGIAHFDAWSSMFGATRETPELNAAGRYDMVTRFAKFMNLPELGKRVRSFMDVLTSSQLSAYVSRPEVKGGKPNIVIAPDSEALKAYQTGNLQPRMIASREWKPSKDQPGNPDPIINIITDGRLSSIDMRYVDSRAKNDPDSKLNKVIDNIIRVYKLTKNYTYTEKNGKPSPVKGAAQVVFYNHGFGANVAATRGFDGRAWINKRLKDAGIPAGEVAWFDEYNTGAKQLQVMKDVREGKKRIIIGHAKALGVGKNLQTRLYASQYIDPPWYPADVTQPHGRILRQGNQHAAMNIPVELNWFATKGSYDSTMWQMVSRKSEAIDQFFAGDDSMRSMEDISETSQFAMAQALSSGDDRIIKLVQLQGEVERYGRLKEAWHQQQAQLRSDKISADNNQEQYTKQIGWLKDANKKVGSYVSRFTGTVDGRTYDKHGEFGEALMKAYNRAVDSIIDKVGPDKGDEKRVVKEYAAINGIPLVAEVNYSVINAEAVATNLLKVSDKVQMEIDRLVMYPEGTDGTGLGKRVVNRINDVSNQLAELERKLADTEDKLKLVNKKLGAPFEHEQAFVEKIAEVAQLQAELTAEGEDVGEQPAVNAAEEGLLFWRNESLGGKAIEAKELDVIINRFKSNLSNAPEINVFETFADLAAAVPEIQEYANDSGDDTANVAGVYHKGKVYLIRLMIASEADAQEALFHETFGHYGIRSLLGNEFFDKMLELYNAIGGATGLAKIAGKQGINMTPYGQAYAKLGYTLDERRVFMTEELLTHIQGNRSTPTIMQKIKELVGAFRAALRKTGFIKLAEYGETDLLHLMQRSAEYVRSGVRKDKTGTMFLLKPSASPAGSFATTVAESLADAAANVKAQDLARLLNPVDWSKTAQWFDDFTPNNVKRAIAYVFRIPVFEAENDSRKLSFVKVGEQREIGRMEIKLAMWGGVDLDTLTGKSWQERVKNIFSWTNGDQQSTEWGKIRAGFTKLSKEQQRLFTNLFVEGDRRNQVYQTLRGTQLNSGLKGLEQGTFELYQQTRNHIDSTVASVRLREVERMMKDAGIPKEDRERRIADYRNELKQRDGWFTRNHGEGEWVVNGYRTVDKLDWKIRTVEGGKQAFLKYFPGGQVNGELIALAKANKVQLTNSENGAVIATGGYLERFVEQSQDIIPAIIKAKGKAPRVKVYVHYFQTKAGANSLAEKANKNVGEHAPHYAGEKIEFKTEHSSSLTESMFQDMKNDMAMEAGLLKSAEKAFKRGDLSEEEYKALTAELIHDTAEILLGRAAGKYQIRRAPYLIEGYQKDNVLELFDEYITGVAGMLSKAQYAKDQFDLYRRAADEVKPWAERYIKDSLQVQGIANRWSGNLRSFAALWYMGFRPASAAINATQIFTLGQAELSRYTASPVVAILKAQKDVLSDKLTADEKKIFNTAIYQVHAMQTVMAEMSGHDEGRTGAVSKALHFATDKAMALFQMVEVNNRKTMLLAAYRAFKAKGMNHDAAFEAAADVDNKVNFAMGRFNLPGWARNPVGRTAYALQSFIWNQFNWIYNRATSGEKDQMIALLRYTAALVVIGGMAALPGQDELDKLLRRMLGKSYKLQLQQWMARHAKEYGTIGEAVNAFAWHGFPAPVAGVNISNAIKMQIPVVTQMLGGEGLIESSMGVFGGMAKKIGNAGMYAGRGMTDKALESLAPEAIAGPMRAYRSMTEGVTTGHGKRVFDEKGKALKYSGTDAAKRSLGFQPLDQSTRTEVAMQGQALQKFWSEERQQRLDELRAADSSAERQEAVRGIMRYNRDLRKSQAMGLVNIISAETIRKARISKPNKKTTGWLRENIVQ